MKAEKKRLRSYLALVLAMVMVLSFVPVFAHADDEETSEVEITSEDVFAASEPEAAISEELAKSAVDEPEESVGAEETEQAGEPGDELAESGDAVQANEDEITEFTNRTELDGELIVAEPNEGDASVQAVTSFTVYFLVPLDWYELDYNRVCLNIQKGGSGDGANMWVQKDMTDTGTLIAGRKLYSVTLTEESNNTGTDCPWGGFNTMQFQAYNNGSWVAQQTAASRSWLPASVFRNRLYSDGSWMDYSPNASTKTVYFDATLSKLQYYGDDIGSTNSYYKSHPSDVNAFFMPALDMNFIYCYATGTGKPDLKGILWPNASGTYDDVYSVDLPDGYTNIAFSTFVMNASNNYGAHGESTTMLSIPTQYANPCFYADDSDPVVYQGGQRDGYWGEAYTLRNAESGKGSTVVDIQNESFMRDDDTYYVSATFYDYYSDFELNGKNKDLYPSLNDRNRFREWVAFRQFDQALSDKYRSAGVSIPLYTGHFQPNWTDDNGEWGFVFSAISDTLNLYGYDKVDQRGFMSTNNSTMGADGEAYTYAKAAQGLVSSTLSGGNIMTADGKMVLPHFDAGFLYGDNSKNTVLGRVYQNVAFPFTRVDKNNNGVYYWYFDSADTTLAMQYDSSTGYYLKDVGNQGWSMNVNSSGGTTGDPVSLTYGFFPFNATSSAATGGTYNFGFGAKLEVKFHLTEDGKVEAEDGTRVPIELEFSGDDDLWVFIDGKLALDVGGSHGRVTGTLNFATMTATVSDVKASQGSSTKGSNVTSSFTISGKMIDQHTMTVFYMERGMWESNLKLNFNFPDENQLSVEKQVDTGDVNPLFDGLFNSHEFKFSIQNLATHYGACDTDASRVGFRTPQFEIRDYGTASSGTLANASGAKYTLGDDTGIVDSDGTFTLKHNQTAVFRDQFRRGSYIALKEELSEQEQKLFTTTWTMYGSDGNPVSSFGTGNSVTNGSKTNLTNQSGTTVDDDRVENIFYEDNVDANSGNKYQSDATAYHPSNTFLFRSYSKPDETIGETALKLEFDNKVNVGSLTIKKEKAYDIDDLTDSYSFYVVFSNVGGLGLEDGTEIKTETFTLGVGESSTITGIPVGTQFTIYEVRPADGSALDSVLCDGDEVTFTKGNGSYSVTGTISEKDTTVSYIFKNSKKPLTELSVVKVWKDAGNEALSDTPDSIYVLLQRSTDGTNWEAASEVTAIGPASGETWENYIYTFIDLDRYVDFTVTPQVEYQYRVIEVDSNGDVLTDNTITIDGSDYTVDYSTSDGTTTITNTQVEVETYCLTITKTVTGNLGNKNQEFSFTIGLTDADGGALTGTYSCTGKLASITLDDNGEASFTLTHGESLTVTELPEGTRYTVTETSADGYKTTVAVGTADPEEALSVTDSLTADVTVGFTNERNVALPTGADVVPYTAFLTLAILPVLMILLRGRRRKMEA